MRDDRVSAMANRSLEALSRAQALDTRLGKRLRLAFETLSQYRAGRVGRQGLSAQIAIYKTNPIGTGKLAAAWL